MSIQSEIGKKGEDLAARYLKDKGFIILERNWRFSRSEVDIIAKKDQLLVFIEVKTRSYNYFGPPESSVNSQKELMLSEAAAAYMRKIDYDWEFRFDIISVNLHNNKCIKIAHYPDAFFPGIH